MNIGFLGTGVMGAGMAARLLATGATLAVWNRHRERAEPLVAQGARLAASPRDAADGVEAIVSMVADDPASRAVWLGPHGALAGAARGTILIESSTLSPAWCEELAGAATETGCSLLDAPVTGSKTQAASGELRFLVGGSADVVERARPILAAMGRETLHLGPTGAGARMKLINNFVCGVQAAALAEALAVIERAGLDRDTALSILGTGAPGSPLVKAVAPRMATPDYTVNFGLALMHKDLSYALADAERLGVPLRTAASARELYTAAIAQGWGDSDFAAIVEPLRAAMRRGNEEREAAERKA
ncbi:MAG TPA: NAD(P)-dependent oxidoreductase [Vicinamibacterales bacterium]|nr:NAD(P)-dependent oxidoreductase [Vicinamibacterales bacterium]